MTTSEAGSEIQVDKETVQRIKDRVLVAEEEQRHLDRPHNILPQIRDIVREEVDQ
jgi:hypothetical protein